MATRIQTNAGFSAALDALVAGFPGLVTKGTCALKTSQGKDMFYVTVKNPSGASSKVQVIVIAGVHAREWAPPDALLSFLTVLLSQGTSGPPSYTPKAIRYPGLLRADKSVRFPRCTISRNDVSSIINNLEIVFLPLANPDGREQSFLPPGTNIYQRKNLSGTASPAPCYLLPDPPPGVSPILFDVSRGTDINRNFPVGWGDSYYSPSFFSSSVAVGSMPCVPVLHSYNKGDSYRGPSAQSEVETQNILSLVASKNPTYFVDLHSAARSILYSWQLANTRTDDPTSNYQNTALNGTRDGTYGEYLPAIVFNKAQALAGAMKAKVLTMQTRDGRALSDPAKNDLSSAYAVAPGSTPIGGPSSHLFKVALYPAPGTSIDAVTALQMSTVASPTPGAAETLVPPERYAITMEAGSDVEGKFWPDLVKFFPKIEREIHMALWAILAKAGAPASGLPVTP